MSVRSVALPRTGATRVPSGATIVLRPPKRRKVIGTKTST
jgi:hypothetical protein